MPKLMPFRYESHEIRIDIDPTGEPWWVAADIGAALDYPNIANVVQRLDDAEEGLRSVYTPETIKRKRFVDGAIRQVNYYQAKDADWIVAMMQAFFASFPAVNRAVATPRET